MNNSESRQRIMKTLGEYGCYFLSIVHLAEIKTQKRIDAVELFLKAQKNKLIQQDATVLEPAKILELATGNAYSVVKESARYQTTVEQDEILVFENGSFKHFVLGNGLSGVAYDPLGNSVTVAKGQLTEKRIFQRKTA